MSEKISLQPDNTGDQPLETLQDIKRIMERSSRFISLSGWSGVAAGICGLAGAWSVHGIIENFDGIADLEIKDPRAGLAVLNIISVTTIGMIVFAVALGAAIFFTWQRSKNTGLPMWGPVAKRLMWNTSLPIIIGAIVVLRLVELKLLGLIAPSCLIFYGLALINGSKYTLGEVKYLGYGQLILGLVNLWQLGYGIYFWAAGFGVLHIIYGFLMWWKYERVQKVT